MSAADQKVERAANKLQQLASEFAGEGGLKAKLAEPLAEDADFVRKLKPSLIKARGKGEAPTNLKPGRAPIAPTGPQLSKRKKPKNGGGPSPFLVIGVALAAGVLLPQRIHSGGQCPPKD